MKFVHCIQSRSHHPIKVKNHSLSLKIPFLRLLPLCFLSPPFNSLPQATTYLLIDTIVFLLLQFYIKRIMWYIVFCTWLFSLSPLFVRFIHLILCINISCWVVFHVKNLPQFVKPSTYFFFPVWLNSLTLFILKLQVTETARELLLIRFWSPRTINMLSAPLYLCLPHSPNEMIINCSRACWNPRWGLGSEVHR